MREDRYTHSEADAAAYERMRSADDPDDQPTLLEAERDEADDWPLPLDGWPDPEPPPYIGPLGEPLSADRRRTQRQREQIDAGTHPLMGGPLHPMAAPEVCSPDAARNAPYTCGSCRFRELMRWHDRAYPKCLRDLYRADQDGAAMVTRSVESITNLSHGAATDCRGWWPACRFYESGDKDLSPDASRVIP